MPYNIRFTRRRKHLSLQIEEVISAINEILGLKYDSPALKRVRATRRPKTERHTAPGVKRGRRESNYERLRRTRMR